MYQVWVYDKVWGERVCNYGDRHNLEGALQYAEHCNKLAVNGDWQCVYFVRPAK